LTLAKGHFLYYNLTMKKLSRFFGISLTAVLILLIGASAAYAAVLSSRNASPAQAPAECPLFFGEDGTFTVLQFADFHEFAFKEKTYTMTDDIKPGLKSYILSALEEVKPDFVVLSGDNIFCLSWLDTLLGISVKTMQYIADIFEEQQVYWTFTFGNHDTEGGVSKQDFIGSVHGYSYFIGGMEDGKWYQALSYEAGTDDYRAGNYSIPVYDSDRLDVAYNIFLLDSGAYPYVPHGVPYRYILDEQTDWYAREADALKAANGGQPVPSVMFTHIPLIEHREAYLQEGTSIGVWAGISPSDTRSSIFEKVMEEGEVRAIFTGHNHNNSYTGFYVSDAGKIMMGVTPQATGDSFWSTGAVSADTEIVMYSRVITLTEDGNLMTWIHTSDKANYPDGVYRGESLSYCEG